MKDYNIFFVCFFVIVSLENLTSDVTELERGMEAVRRESCGRIDGVLGEFLINSEGSLLDLKQQLSTALSAFRETAEYFGECPRTTDPTTFFSFFVRFVKSFKVLVFIYLQCLAVQCTSVD